jgi:hypothetical protein
MESLKFEASIDTPSILMDPEKGIIEISGKSYPEDTLEFYTPVLKWMDEYFLDPKPLSTLIFKLEYFNSSSYKPILDLILKFEELKNNGHQVCIEWHYKNNDTDMKETGVEFAEIVSIPFDFHTF